MSIATGERVMQLLYCEGRREEWKARLTTFANKNNKVVGLMNARHISICRPVSRKMRPQNETKIEALKLQK
jgi:predicted choloylglycine hydrolase